MADRPYLSSDHALADALHRIRQLEARLNQPRTKLMVEDWTISENATGDLVMRHKDGATHVFPK